MYVLYPDYDPTLRAIVMCSIVVLQIVTPFLVYRSLSAIGERRRVAVEQRFEQRLSCLFIVSTGSPGVSLHLSLSASTGTLRGALPRASCR